MFLNFFISSSIFSLRNNAWGFKKSNISFNIQISLNRFSASLQNRSIASSIHLFNNQETYVFCMFTRHLFLPSDTSLFNCNFLLFANLDSSFNICLTSASGSLTKKAIKTFILCEQFFSDKPLCCKYFWVS